MILYSEPLHHADDMLVMLKSLGELLPYNENKEPMQILAEALKEQGDTADHIPTFFDYRIDENNARMKCEFLVDDDRSREYHATIWIKKLGYKAAIVRLRIFDPYRKNWRPTGDCIFDNTIVIELKSYHIDLTTKTQTT